MCCNFFYAFFPVLLLLLLLWLLLLLLLLLFFFFFFFFIVVILFFILLVLYCLLFFFSPPPFLQVAQYIAAVHVYIHAINIQTTRYFTVLQDVVCFYSLKRTYHSNKYKITMPGQFDKKDIDQGSLDWIYGRLGPLNRRLGIDGYNCFQIRLYRSDVEKIYYIKQFHIHFGMGFLLFLKYYVKAR